MRIKKAKFSSFSLFIRFQRPCQVVHKWCASNYFGVRITYGYTSNWLLKPQQPATETDVKQIHYGAYLNKMLNNNKCDKREIIFHWNGKASFFQNKKLSSTGSSLSIYNVPHLHICITALHKIQLKMYRTEKRKQRP